MYFKGHYFLELSVMRLLTLSLLLLSLVSCSTAGVKNIEYVEFKKSIEVDKPFNEVWGYLLEWSAINSFPIEETDKNDGIIKLTGSGTVSRSFFQSPAFQGDGAELDQSLVSCGQPTGNIGLYRAKFTGLTINATIILREMASSTRVTINMSGNAGVEVRNGYGVVSSSMNTCASRGTFEKRIFADLAVF